ncbi:MAG: TlpA disulfide reductase family protein [Minicystis sp.]
MKNQATLAQLVFIAIAAIAVYSFVGAAQRDMKRTSCTALCKLAPAYAGSNRVAPDFELKDMGGNSVRLSQYRGKVVFLNFWTKTCNPCLEEMPSIAELARIAQGRKDFVVLTVSTDEGPEAVRDTLRVILGGDPPFPVLFDPDSKIVLEKYGTRLFPETWVIDPNGVIRARFDGARDWSKALAVEVGEMVGKAGACPVEFYDGKPRGAFAGLCDDES